MTLDDAFAALAGLTTDTLLDVGFIALAEALEIDPADAIEPSGDETEFVTWAALTRGETRTVRTLLGRPEPRYVVEHRATLQLVWAGPDPVAGKARHAQALVAIAALPNASPTLGGLAERFFIEQRTDEPLPPNGWGTTLICAFRIRSGDPLGLTP